MSSEYRIHKPYALAVLPRPLDHTDGRIVAGEVYGHKESQRKRKRTELVVGIDGETASIYDVPASRLITSYPVPPQASFTCPPYSARLRRNGTDDVFRYTYAVIRDGSYCTVTLFKDVVHADGKTTSTTVAQTLQTPSISYLTCSSTPSELASIGHVIAVGKKGEVYCLSGETLKIQWTASIKSVIQDAVASTVGQTEVDFITSETLDDLKEGIFKGKDELLSALPRKPSLEPDILVAITRSVVDGSESRHLVVMAALSGASSADAQTLIPLDVVSLASTTEKNMSKAVYQLDSQSRSLLELREGSMSVYSLAGTVPTLKSVLPMDDAVTFTRLSRPFLLSASLTSMGLINHQYRSVHARSTMDLSDLPAEAQSPVSCELITYLRSQQIVVARLDNILVSIKIEAPQDTGKRKRGGFLIDSIGRGTAVDIASKKTKCSERVHGFSQTLPGSVTESYIQQYNAETQAADEYLRNGELEKWDDLLREKLLMTYQAEEANGKADDAKMLLDDLPEWKWLPHAAKYPQADRRWILFAMTQVFAVEGGKTPAEPQTLELILPESNALTYLVTAGHLTLANIKSAFREDLQGASGDPHHLGKQVVNCLVSADPSMTFLLDYVQATKLGEVELLLSMRALMLSMDLIRDEGKIRMLQLLDSPQAEINPDEMDLDDLERQLAITEHYLGDDAGDRQKGLTMALIKLWRLPAPATVRAMRSTLETADIISMLLVLRVELNRGAWTILYEESTPSDQDGNDTSPDGAIALIAELMSRCLDAVGQAGWLVNDSAARNQPNSKDYLTSMRLDVSAALEGIEQASMLEHFLAEAVRYGRATQKSNNPSRQTWSMDKPIAMSTMVGAEGRMLPLGLKVRQAPSNSKVVSGGEVVKRTSRERGHLISKQVAAYSLEKLAF